MADRLPVRKGQLRKLEIMTYRLLALVSLGSIDGIMVLCNMQMQVMLVWEILLALAASVHMHLLVMHIVVLKRCESKRLVWGQ